MFNSIRHLALLLALMPALAFAQQPAAPSTPAAPEAPCPSANVKALEAHRAVAPANPYLLSLASARSLASLSQTGAENQQPNVEMAFDAEKRKTINKAYKVSSSDMLNIENKFGRVHVNTWNKNEIQVKVEIIARAGTDQRAQDILDNIRVVDAREGQTISLRTQLEPMKISGNNQKSFEINYTVSMPDNNPLTIKNSFGDVYLPAFKGKTNISVKYGTLKTDRLSNSANTVKLAYSTGNCGYINGGNVEVAYSNLNLGGTNGIQGFSKYSDFKIGSLNDALDFDVKYGSFRVDNVSKNIRRINLDSGFSPISLNFEDDSAFSFDVNVQFGDFNVDKNLVNITSLEKDYTSAEYKGKFGGASPKGVISINSKYGDVKFTR